MSLMETVGNSQMAGRRILFVAMQHSIHVARWIAMIAGEKWDLHLFPLDENAPNPDLRGVTLHWPLHARRGAGLREATVFYRMARFGTFALRDPGGAVRRLKSRWTTTGAKIDSRAKKHPGSNALKTIR